MKKFLFLALALAITFAANAQSVTLMPLVLGDTIVNTGTVSKVFTASAGYSGAAIQVVLNKISGTGAGTVQPMGSLDGVNYVNIGSAFTITNVALQTQTFYLTPPLPQYIKILSTGSGTEAVQQRVYYVLRRYQP
jgi:hypothetical protein